MIKCNVCGKLKQAVFRKPVGAAICTSCTKGIKMPLLKKDSLEFKNAFNIIKVYLQQNHDPNTKIIITQQGVEIMQAVSFIPFKIQD